jgi:hypothetical protein
MGFAVTDTIVHKALLGRLRLFLGFLGRSRLWAILGSTSLLGSTDLPLAYTRHWLRLGGAGSA